MSQRSRWLKGWMQATLVHGRARLGQKRLAVLRPRRRPGAYAGGGARRARAAALHWRSRWRGDPGREACWHRLRRRDAVPGLASRAWCWSAARFALVWPMLAGARREGLRMGAADLLMLPFYYAMWSAAAWRAAWELIWRPALNKTTHARRPEPGARSRR